MTKQMIIGMFGLAILGTSCDKHKQHYGTYDSTETRTYEGAMMAPDVDLSEQNYILTVESEENDRIILNNLYTHGTQVKTDIDGSALSIRKQSLDGFLEIEGNGTIGNGVIHLNYNVITPDGNVICVLSAGKLE
jgi:hypothetical protein